jgi:hypothetical protein
LSNNNFLVIKPFLPEGDLILIELYLYLILTACLENNIQRLLFLNYTSNILNRKLLVAPFKVAL